MRKKIVNKKVAMLRRRKGGKRGGPCKKVELVSPGPQPGQVSLSEGNHEGVYWHNGTDRGRTIRFKAGNWPFVDPPQDITIDPGKSSKCFRIYQGQPKFIPFTYSVDPTLVPQNQPGPGDPSIVGDD